MKGNKMMKNIEDRKNIQDGRYRREQMIGSKKLSQMKRRN